MINDVVDLNNTLRMKFKETLGLAPNYFRAQNQKAPIGDIQNGYATLLVHTPTSIGWDSDKFSDLDPETGYYTETICGVREAYLNIHFFRERSHFLAQTLYQQFHSSLYKEFFSINNIGLMDMSPIRNLDENTEGGDWVAHAQFDVHINFVDTIELKINSYNTIPTKIIESSLGELA